MPTHPMPRMKHGIMRRVINNPRVWPWLPAIVMLVVPMFLALSLEGRIANPFQQYLGVFPGDGFLSVAMGMAVWLSIHHLVHSPRRWFRKWRWHACSATLGVLAAGGLYYFDYQNMVYRSLPEAAYTSDQFYGPTHLFHFVLVAAGGYVLGTIVVPTLIHTPRRLWRHKLVIILFLIAWAICALVLDNILPRPNLADVHGEWFGGWYLD